MGDFTLSQAVWVVCAFVFGVACTLVISSETREAYVPTFLKPAHPHRYAFIDSAALTNRLVLQMQHSLGGLVVFDIPRASTSASTLPPKPLPPVGRSGTSMLEPNGIM
jgi:hypothetical protein